MNNLIYFEVCDELLDYQLTTSNIKKDIIEINKVLSTYFKPYTNDELINIYKKACLIYKKNKNHQELKSFIFTFSLFTRNKKKKVHKFILSNKELVLSLSRFNAYFLYEYIILNLELYNNDYKKLFHDLKINKMDSEIIRDLNIIFERKLFDVRCEVETYNMYINILKILNEISPYFSTTKKLKEYEEKKNESTFDYLSTDAFKLIEEIKKHNSVEFIREEVYRKLDLILHEKPYCTSCETSASLFNEFNNFILYIF